MTQILYACNSANGVAVSAGVTDYFGVGSGFYSTSTTEANNQVINRNAGTFSKLHCRLVSNSATSTSTLKYRVGGVNGNQNISVGAGAIGEFTDSTNTDVSASGDKLAIQVVNGGGGIIGFGYIAELFAPSTTGNTVNRLFSSGNFSAAASTNYFITLGGQLTTTTTEANQQITNRVTATLQNLAIFVSVNTAATATYLTRKGGVNGNLSISIGSGVTGLLEDTTNTDSIASGDLINTELSTGTLTNLTVTTVAIDYLTTTGETLYGQGQTGGVATVNANLTRYYGISGVMRNDGGGGETFAQMTTDVAFTAHNAQLFLTANTVTATSTLKFRKGAVDGNQSVSITASTTGFFEDAVNTDAVIATDKINTQLITGATGTSMTLGNMAILAAYGGASVTVNSWYPVYPDQIRLNLRSQADFFFGTYPTPPAITQLSFFPSYPDSSLFNYRPQVDFTFQNPLPLKLPLSWLPQYKDQIRFDLKVQKDFVFDHPLPLNLPLPWLPDYTNQNQLFNQQIPSGAVETITLLATTSTLPWLPNYPVPIPPLGQINPSGQAFEVETFIPDLLVATLTSNQGGTAVPNFTFTLAYNTQAGDTIMIGISQANSTDLVASVTSPGFTFQNIPMASSASHGFNFLSIWYAANVPAATTPTITVDFGGSSIQYCATLRHYRGLTANPLDRIALATTTTNSTAATSATTTSLSSQNELIVGWFLTDDFGVGENFQAINSYLSIAEDTNLFTCSTASEDKVVNSNAGVSSSVIFDTAATWVASVTTWIVANNPLWLPVLPNIYNLNYRPQIDFLFENPQVVKLPISWLPIHPSQVPPFNQQMPSGSTEPILPLNFRLSWLPQYADSVRQNLKVQDTSQFFVVPSIAAATVLSWFPEYTDSIRANLRSQADFVFEPVQPLNIRLPWLPDYPNQIPYFIQQLPGGETYEPIFAIPIVSGNTIIYFSLNDLFDYISY